MKSPYIELTNLSTGKPISLNVLHIVAIFGHNTTTVLVTTPGLEYYVTEDYATVTAKMDATLDG